MKTTRLHRMALLALAAVGISISSAQGQATSSAGELLMGFRATGGTGVTKNYVIDLGPAATFRDYATVQTLPLTGVAADLASASEGYGASWHTRTDVFWGVVGSIGNFSAVNSDPAKTLYASKVETTNGVKATAWPRQGDSTQSFTTSIVASAKSGFNGASAATNASTIAKTMTTSDTNNWSAFQPGGGQSGGISFQTWGSTIEGNPGQYLDLFRMTVDSGNGPGDFVGRMILNSDATLTFIPGALVGVNAVQFSAATYSAAENVGSGVLNVTINRTGDTSSTTTINISTTEGTATDPEDFTAISNQAVTFAANESSKVVPITIINRSGDQGDRSFTVTLSGATGGTTIGSQGTATCTITEASLPSQVAFAQSTFTANQGDNSVTVQLVRTGGADSVSVTLSATAGTATAGTDYTAPTGPSATITFGSNTTTATGTITLLPRPAVTQHLEFNVSIASGGANPTVTSPSTALVRILVADTNKPTVTIGATTPAATVLENPSDTVPVSGIASDDKTIIDRVEVSLNGGAVVNATLTPSATSTNYSLTANQARGLRGGSNTVKVQAFDAKGNASVAVTKIFTYSVKRTLAPVASPNATAGTITGSTAAEVGKAFTLKAVAKPGFIFDHWTMTGVTGAPTELATLNVTLTDTMAATFTSTSANAVSVSAVFITNPFVANVIGKFQGLAIADGSSTPSNSTNGFINLDLTVAGTFTGTLSIDGFALSISGAFDNTGVAKFGPTRSTTLLVARTNKPSYELALQMAPVLPVASPDGSQTITGTLKQKYRSTLISNSIVTLRRSFYSATNKLVDTAVLANKGLYNIALPAETQTTLTDIHDYPQGSGFGTITVTNLGAVNLASTLADGTTKVTASGYLSKGNIAPLYTQLYTLKAGSLGGLVTVDGTQTNTDVAGADFFWFRPWQNVQYYPWGWPEGIKLDLIGTKLKVASYTAAAAIIPGLPLTANNATLTFNDGLLSGLFDTTKDMTITHPTATSTLVTNVPLADTSFKLTVNTTAASFTGDFDHSNGTRPKFNGVILQKGANSKGFGFFQTIAPKVIDGTGETGGVILSHK